MPAKKPADKLQRRNTTRPLDNQIIAMNTAEAPAAPKGLTKDLRAYWVELWGSDLAAHWNRVSDARPLGRLFGLYARLEKYERIGDKNPLSEGSTGQTVMHPFLKEASGLRKDILALEQQFGITPGARFKMAINLGQAALSLDDMNKRLLAQEVGEDDDDEEDPRIVEAEARRLG